MGTSIHVFKDTCTEADTGLLQWHRLCAYCSCSYRPSCITINGFTSLVTVDTTSMDENLIIIKCLRADRKKNILRDPSWQQVITSCNNLQQTDNNSMQRLAVLAFIKTNYQLALAQ